MVMASVVVVALVRVAITVRVVVVTLHRPAKRKNGTRNQNLAICVLFFSLGSRNHFFTI